MAVLLHRIDSEVALDERFPACRHGLAMRARSSHLGGPTRVNQGCEVRLRSWMQPWLVRGVTWR
jgi:hypothetical protein